MILNSYPINTHIIPPACPLYAFKYGHNYIQPSIQKMLNFASLFNQFRSQSNSGINELLDQPTTKISRLLD